MKILIHIRVVLVLVLFGFGAKVSGQAGVGPAPYCMPLYSALPCNSPGPSNAAGNGINDFINSFNTTGAVTNITNNNSGCNAQNFAGVGIRNYFYFGCTQYLVVNPGQVITCNFQSGNTYGQGFTAFVDWNQNGVFNLPGERVTSIIGVPAPGTFNASNFTVPIGQPGGVYRMRVRCAYATGGPTIDPCLNYGFGETEDYNLYVTPSGPAGVFTATASSNAPMCSGNPVNLTVSSSATVPLTYTWSGPGGFNSNIQNPTIAVGTASMSGVYSVTVSPGSCPITKTVNVQITNYPAYTVTPITATVCQGGVFTPSVSFGAVLPGTNCSNVGVGPACASPNIIQVGTQSGQNTAFGWPAPYGNYYKNTRHQLLFTAAELNALGITQGYITSLAFNVLTINGSTNFPGYTIRLKCTNVAALSGGFDNVGLTQVYTIPNYVAATGWNTHVFNTPYVWDGVSNLLVDVCYNLTASYTQNCISPFMTTTFNSCRVFYSDFQPACMTTNFPMLTNTSRPLVRFGNCGTVNPSQFSYLWTQGPGIAAPTASSTAITAQPITGSIATVFYSITVTQTVMSCPVMQQLTVTVLNPASPTITAPNPLCNTSPTIAITAVPGGGTWTTNGAVSSGGVITPILASIGTSSVLYSVGMGSCISTNTTNISVSQFNTAAFSSSIAPMCVTSPVVDLMSIVQNTLTGIWSGVNVSGTYSFNPAGLVTNTYTLVYNTSSTPIASVCPDSDTMVVSVLNPIQPTITAIGPYCNTATDVQMIVNPTTGTWTPVTYQTASGVFSPSMAAIGVNTVQYVVGTFTCNVQHTSTINIEAFIPATISGSVTDKCNNGTAVNLTPLTVNSGTWVGPGVSANMFDPTTSGVGVITLTFNTNSTPVGLCPDNAQLSVNVFSLATPVLTQIGPFCNVHGNSQIPVTPIGGTFFGVNTSGVNAQGVFMPAQANIGSNVVSYSIVSGPCVATGQTTVSVEKFKSADFSSLAGPYCRNDGQINLNSIAQNPGGVWNGPGVNGSIFTPALANIGNNNFITYFTNSLPTPSLCPDSNAIRILVNDLPKVTIISNINKGCIPVDVVFNTPSTNTGFAQWNFGDGSAIQNGLNVSHQYTTPGSFTVSLSYQDDIGCSTQTTMPSPVNVYPMPNADFVFSPEEITIAVPEVQFSNLSTVLGNNTYLWQIGNMYQLSDVNPKVTFPKAGEYNIILVATTAEGCVHETTKKVVVLNDYGVYIPSSFTPNFDGLNDVFKPVFSPYGLDLKVYDLEIFDRWGHSQFHTKDYTVGWDGMAKGTDEPMKQEVYVYKVKYKDSDGKIHQKTGHLTLVK